MTSSKPKGHGVLDVIFYRASIPGNATPWRWVTLIRPPNARRYMRWPKIVSFRRIIDSTQKNEIFHQDSLLTYVLLLIAIEISIVSTSLNRSYIWLFQWCVVQVNLKRNKLLGTWLNLRFPSCECSSSIEFISGLSFKSTEINALRTHRERNAVRFFRSEDI